MQNKTVIQSFRLTKKEKEELAKRAKKEGVKVGEFIRIQLFGFLERVKFILFISILLISCAKPSGSNQETIPIPAPTPTEQTQVNNCNAKSIFSLWWTKEKDGAQDWRGMSFEIVAIKKLGSCNYGIEIIGDECTGVIHQFTDKSNPALCNHLNWTMFYKKVNDTVEMYFYDSKQYFTTLY